ncbi:hypothetical protein ACLKA7_007748 [Drosophila subpalustris]
MPLTRIKYMEERSDEYKISKYFQASLPAKNHKDDIDGSLPWVHVGATNPSEEYSPESTTAAAATPTSFTSPHPVSNCQHHGSGEAWRRHPTPHGQVSIKQLIGYWCPSWASGSHHHHHDHHQPVQQQQQQRLQRHQQRSNWPIHMPLVWPLRQPQMHMGASAVLLLLATIQLMLIWGIT